jgi:integrase
MSWIVKTPKNTYRANWRDPTGKQRAKTFKRAADAKRFLADIELQLAKGLYIDPHAANTILLRDYVDEWQRGRMVELTTAESTLSALRTHVIPKWGRFPLSRIDHSAIQEWVAELSKIRAAATVARAAGVLAMVLNMAVRARILAVNPCDGIRLPKRWSERKEMLTIGRSDFRNILLPEIPERYRALVCLAAGAGLRWGECLGLSWSALDLNGCTVSVQRVAVEVGGKVSFKAYPKSRAGLRRVPLPRSTVNALERHAAEFKNSPDLVFATSSGGGLLRGNFRQRVWRPAVIRAGLLGSVSGFGPYLAAWPCAGGGSGSAYFDSEQRAVSHIARVAYGGLRFHDLRHSYATWLVSDGVPVNIVQRLMGHENASTTLNRYVHAPTDFDERVRDFFNDGDDAADGVAVVC